MNDTLPPALLSGRVERYSDKPISDGITIDEDNNIYLGDWRPMPLALSPPIANTD